MQEPNDPKSAETTAPESWLGKDIKPILAVGTVILTFGMFYYFVNLACTQSKESVQYNCTVKALTDVEARFAQLSSSKAEPAKQEEVRRMRDRLKIQVTIAKEAADDAKERRGMVKDFILYILGVLSSALTTIFGYYFGSSKGSSEKTTALNTIASRTPPPAGTHGGSHGTPPNPAG